MPPDETPFDPFDRGTFYGKPAPAPSREPTNTDEDADYELEGPDEQVLEGERRRAEAELLKAQSAVDIDAIYREVEAEPDWGEMWAGFRFRYQTKHLLILTTVVAVLTTAITSLGWPTVIILGTVLCLAGAHGYLAWRENQRQQRLEVRRKQIYERARMVREGTSVANLPPIEMEEEESEPVVEGTPFQFNFSRNEYLITAVIALVLVGLIYATGFNSAAIVVGFIALVGLAAHAFGFEPPGIVVLGW